MKPHRHLSSKTRTWIALPTALAIATVNQGCLLWTGETLRPAVPSHPGERVATAEAAPRIRWVIQHEYRREDAGDSLTAIPEAQTHTAFKRALEIVQPTVPFVAHASIDEPDPEFLLVLDTSVDRHGGTSEFLSGVTLFIIPWFVRRDYTVCATLRTVEGADLISHEASAELRGIAHLLFLPLFPWILTHQPGGERFVEPMRSAIGAVAADFASLPPDRSTPAPSSAATRETTE